MQARGHRRIVVLLLPLSLAAAVLLRPDVAGAATITITTLAEFDDNECTLPQALFAANFDLEGAGTCPAGDGADMIAFAPGVTGTIELTGTLVVSEDATIIGPGASALTVRRDDLAMDFRIFQINSGTTATIQGMTISNGRVNLVNMISGGGAGIINSGTLTLEGVVVTDNHVSLEHDSLNPATPGGGILNQPTGTLTIRRSTVSDNTLTVSQTAASGGTIATAMGGGIASFGPLVIERSTISGNSASASVASPDAFDASTRGAGLEVQATSADIRLSTISGNTATATAPMGVTTSTQGSGVWSASETLTITSSTIAFNTGTMGANLYADPTFGGATETVSNTILSDPVGGTNCGPSDIDVDGGNNLAFPSVCTGLAALGADPQLQPLADNGGPTFTHALPATSPAIDAGTSGGDTTDQRGLPRPVNFAPANSDDGADIGAFEQQDVTAPTDPSLASPSHVVGAPSNDTTVDVTWTGATDAASGVDGFSFLFSTSPTTVPDDVKDAEDTATGTTSPPLADGSHWFHLRTRDNAGNWTATAHLGPFAIDTDAPLDPAVASPSHTVGAPSNDTTVDVTWSGATDAASGVDGFSFLFSTSPTTVPDDVKDAEETATGTTSPPLADGSHWFHLRTRDNAGNWTATAHLGPFAIDTDPPESTFTKQPKKQIETDEERVRVRFAFLSDEPGVTFECKRDGQAWKPCASPQVFKVKPGKHAFRIRATDQALNTDATPALRRFKVVPAS